MKIYAAVVHHEYGSNLYLARSYRGLMSKLYGYVKEWWEHEMPEGEEIPGPLEKSKAVARYFDYVEREYCDEYCEEFK